MNTLEKAIVIAIKAHAHKNQRDKGGAPYILHPLRVMLKLRTENEMMAAVLHDVVEDTHCTLADLRKRGIPDEVTQAVDCLTKREGESYDHFIQCVKSNPISRKVKLADLADNMDITRITQLSVDDVQRLNKYLRAWRDLSSDPQSKPATKSRLDCKTLARKVRTRKRKS